MPKYIDTDKLIERIERIGPAVSKYAKAKAERIYLEQYRKSLKAILMGKAAEKAIKTIADKESFAYSHQEYLDHLVALRCAVEVEEKHKFALEGLKVEVEVWRTMQANQRFQQDRV